MPLGSEESLYVLVLLGMGAAAIYLFVLWIIDAPRTPDPWDREIDDKLHDQEAVPICHHCFSPQTHNGWFCPECGATVGPYSNYMPYIYIFSEGEALRAGVTEHLRHSFLTIAGLVLLSLSMFALVAPFYWFVLLKHLRQKDSPMNTTPT